MEQFQQLKTYFFKLYSYLFRRFTQGGYKHIIMSENEQLLLLYQAFISQPQLCHICTEDDQKSFDMEKSFTFHYKPFNTSKLQTFMSFRNCELTNSGISRSRQMNENILVHFSTGKRSISYSYQAPCKQGYFDKNYLKSASTPLVKCVFSRAFSDFKL